MNRFSEFISEIVREREKIWLKEPSELKALKEMAKGRGGNFPVRIYAWSDGYRNQRNLWMFRSLFKEGDVKVEAAGSLLAPFFREMADRYGIWELDTPRLLFGKAEAIVGAAESKQELVQLLDELLIYNNRWWLWMDVGIPWFDLD